MSTKRYTIIVMERQSGQWSAELEDEDGGLMATAYGPRPRQLAVEVVQEAFDEDAELP